MAEQITNIEKYENYREQMGRLKRAIGAKFFLEAVFIEYAIMEDRLESIVRRAGYWTFQKDRVRVNINDKLKKMVNALESKDETFCKYFDSEFIKEIDTWKTKRNPYIHDLLNKKITTADLEEFALRGQEIVKKLNSSSTNYKRALQRQSEKN